MKLYIAEKPSLGGAIADVLPKPHRKADGCIYVGTGDCVSRCVGHLLEQAEPDPYDPKFKQPPYWEPRKHQAPWWRYDQSLSHRDPPPEFAGTREAQAAGKLWKGDEASWCC